MKIEDIKNINFNARIRIKGEPNTLSDLMLNSRKQSVISKALISNPEGIKGYAYTSAGSCLNSTAVGISILAPNNWKALISYPFGALSLFVGQKWIYKGLDIIRAAESKIIPTLKNIPD